jgi:hypothetical protein
MNFSETSTPVLRDENNITKSGKLQLAERLDNWKEIALYLRRSVRCVQRWEKNEGMPVRRHSHANGKSVYALRDELHAWLQTRQFRSIEIPSPGITVRLQEPASGSDSAASTLKARGLTAILLVLRHLTGRILVSRFLRIADLRPEREQILSDRR